MVKIQEQLAGLIETKASELGQQVSKSAAQLAGQVRAVDAGPALRALERAQEIKRQNEGHPLAQLLDFLSR